jgi:hypothetical protein
MAGGVNDRMLVPGKLFRDLDGSLVHLVSVERELCRWVPLSDAETNCQVTHRENFRRRFRSYDDTVCDAKAAA